MAIEAISKKIRNLPLDMEQLTDIFRLKVP
jgi:hypothetical protein